MQSDEDGSDMHASRPFTVVMVFESKLEREVPLSYVVVHFFEEGSDRQASMLLRIMAVALRVLDREDEAVKMSEQEEEAGSERHSDAVAAESITEASVEGRLDEEL